MENLTFEQLPKAVANLSDKLDKIQALLLQKGNEQVQEEDKLLTVKEAAAFLSLKVPTIYGLIKKNELPVMKRSKRCSFSKVELMNYLKQGRKKTNNEIEAIAKKHISTKS